jgi:pyruvate dehydrogenase E2 component (dihydrolipoamide acetyltransferase)
MSSTSSERRNAPWRSEVSLEFLLPDPGEGIHEADILEIHVASGDEVKDGDPLFTVETDKAVVDIPSSFDGRIDGITVEVGDVIEVGAVLLTYTPFGEAETSKDIPGEADVGSTDDEASPIGVTAVKRRPVPASPATRSLARRLDVDLHEIQGSGPDGRIEPEDVQAAAAAAVATGGEKERAGAESHAEPAEGRVRWVDLNGVRRATARQMATSWREIPHVSHHDFADITDLDVMRRAHAERVEAEGGHLSITMFLLKAAATALRDHPRFNCIIDAENSRVGLKEDINIGVAVDSDDGLVVPVIEHVDRKSIVDLAREVPEISRRMREGKRSLEDMKGATFTITNPGAIGGTSFNPIINPPQVAILGAAQARLVPVVVETDGPQPEFVARLHLPLVLAFDHRVNDGADAARFMNDIKRLLEDPTFLALRA